MLHCSSEDLVLLARDGEGEPLSLGKRLQSATFRVMAFLPSSLGPEARIKSPDWTARRGCRSWASVESSPMRFENSPVSGMAELLMAAS